MILHVSFARWAVVFEGRLQVEDCKCCGNRSHFSILKKAFRVRFGIPREHNQIICERLKRSTSEKSFEVKPNVQHMRNRISISDMIVDK